MANNVYVGNPGLNPTVNTGTGQEFSYNPIDPLQVQQAIAAQSAARQAEYEAQQAAQQQARQQQAAQQAEVPAGTFDPNQTINFTQFAADNGWADSSTFRRKELADKLLADAKTAGAPPAYLDALNTAMHKKAEEWKQPITNPDRGWGLTDGVAGDVVAGAARGVNSLVGLAADISTVLPTSYLTTSAINKLTGNPLGVSVEARTKAASDKYIGGFERGMQSTETKNLLARANELISEGRWEDLTGFVASNPSIAAYAGIPELLGAKGGGVAAKGVSKATGLALNATRLAEGVAVGSRAYKAIEFGKGAVGLSTVMGAQGAGQVLNDAEIAGKPLTADTYKVAAQTGAAMAGLGVFGHAAGSVEAIFARAPILGRIFKSADDVERLAITATTAPKELASVVFAMAKTAGVEMTQEYAENTAQSLLSARLDDNGNMRELNDLDYKRAYAEGVYGALLSAGPGGAVGGIDAHMGNLSAKAYNSVIETKKTEQRVEDAKIKDAQDTADRVATTINEAAVTSDQAIELLNQERAQREATAVRGAELLAQARQDAVSSDPLVAAQANEALVQQTIAQAQLENRQSAVQSASRFALEQSTQADIAQQQEVERTAAGIASARENQKAVRYAEAVNEAGIRSDVPRSGNEWDSNFASGQLMDLAATAPTIDFTNTADPIKTLSDAAAATNDPVLISQFMRATSKVQRILEKNRPAADTARRVLAQGIAAGQPFDVEKAVVQAAPHLSDPDMRMAFLSAMPPAVLQQLNALDTQNPQQSLPGFALQRDIPVTDIGPPTPVGVQARGLPDTRPYIPPVQSDMFANAPESLTGGAITELEKWAGYATPRPQADHMRAAEYAVNMNEKLDAATAAHRDAVAASIAARQAAWEFAADDTSPEATAVRAQVGITLAAARRAKAELEQMRPELLVASSRSVKFQMLVAGYSTLVETNTRNRNFIYEASRFKYVEEAADTAADLILEQMQQYNLVQDTPTPTADTIEGGFTGVKFNLGAWTPSVNSAARTRAILGKSSKTTKQARATRLAATSEAVKGLGLGTTQSSAEISRRRTAQHTKLNDVVKNINAAQDRVDAAQRDVDAISPGDKGLASGAVRLRLATTKQTLASLKTTQANLITGLKTLDPAAYLDYKTKQDEAANNKKIAELEAALKAAEKIRDDFVVANAAIAQSPKYARSMKSMLKNIATVTKKLDDVRGTTFDYAAESDKIVKAYQEAVLAATTITPAAIASFDSRAVSTAKSQVLSTDFVAAYDAAGQMAGTAILHEDGLTWEVKWEDDSGVSKSTQIVTAEGGAQEAFKFFLAQNLSPSMRSREVGQSPHALRALRLDERVSGLSKAFLKGVVALGGESWATRALNAVDYFIYSEARRIKPLESIDKTLAANGVTVESIASRFQRTSGAFNAYRRQVGADTQSHQDAIDQVNNMISGISDYAKPFMDDFAYATSAASRHAFLNADGKVDPNTGEAKTRTTGFSYKDPNTGATIPDPDGSRFMQAMDGHLSPEDVARMKQVVVKVSEQGLIVSRIEARTGVITEQELIRRTTEHEAGKYYLPFQDSGSTSLSKGVKGRGNKAASPLTRMIMNMDARLGVAATMENKNSLYDLFMAHPMPHIATINPEVEVADGEGNIKWISEDPFSNRTIRMLTPEGKRVRITFAETGIGAQLADSLTPRNLGDWVTYANMTKSYFSKMLTTFSPKLHFVAMMRDMLMMLFNFEQASGGLFGPMQSLKLGVKAALKVPFSAPAALKGQMLPSSRSPLVKHALADGGFINMAFRNEYIQQLDAMNIKSGFTAVEGGSGSKLRRVSKGVHTLEETLHYGDVAARTAYLEVATTAIAGKPLRTDEDIMLFKSQYPSEWSQILLGTKNTTLNFESMGANPYLRALIPFYGTAMNATFGALPRGLATTSGKVYTTAVIAAGYLTAMAAASGGGEDDEDPDGKKKFFRRSNLATNVQLGGLAVPLPQEMYFFHSIGTSMAALQSGEWGMGDAIAHVATAGVKGFSPVQISDSPNTADVVLGAGPWGFLMQPLITQNDAFGRPLANPTPLDANGDRIESPADWEAAYENSAEWSKSLAKAASPIVDMSPGAYEQTARILLGGLYSFGKDVSKDDVSAVDSIASRFIPKDNPYAMGKDYQDLEQKYNRLARDPANQNNLMAPATKVKTAIDQTNSQVSSVGRQITDNRKSMAAATAAGQPLQAAMFADRIAKLEADQQNLKGNVMRQIYDKVEK